MSEQGFYVSGYVPSTALWKALGTCVWDGDPAGDRTRVVGSEGRQDIRYPTGPFTLEHTAPIKTFVSWWPEATL